MSANEPVFPYLVPAWREQTRRARLQKASFRPDKKEDYETANVIFMVLICVEVVCILCFISSTIIICAGVFMRRRKGQRSEVARDPSVAKKKGSRGKKVIFFSDREKTPGSNEETQSRAGKMDRSTSAVKTLGSYINKVEKVDPFMKKQESGVDQKLVEEADLTGRKALSDVRNDRDIEIRIVDDTPKGSNGPSRTVSQRSRKRVRYKEDEPTKPIRDRRSQPHMNRSQPGVAQVSGLSENRPPNRRSVIEVDDYIREQIRRQDMANQLLYRRQRDAMLKKSSSQFPSRDRVHSQRQRAVRRTAASHHRLGPPPSRVGSRRRLGPEDFRTRGLDCGGDREQHAQREFEESKFRSRRRIPENSRHTNIHRTVLHSICHSVVEVFETSVVECAVACWEWLLSARPDFRLPFFQEMISAWLESVDLGLGIFTPASSEGNPLSSSRSEELAPRPPTVIPHAIWIKFISDRVDLVKYFSQDEAELFARMFHRTLAAFERLPPKTPSRHICTVGTRFSFLNAALAVVQGDVLPKSIAKNALRQRIYIAALDFFASKPQTPVQTRCALRSDITILTRFWHALYQDKKYLKASLIADLIESGPFLTGALTGDGHMQLSRPSIIANSPGGSYLTGGLPGPLPSPNPGTISEESTLLPRSATSNTIGWINTVPSNPSTLSRRSIGGAAKNKLTNPTDNFVKEYLKKRNFILSLLAGELERLTTWYRPQGILPEVTLPSQDSVNTWRLTVIPDKTWRDYVKLSWSLNPILAVYLPQRFPSNADVIRREVSRFVGQDPDKVAQCPDALSLLVTADTILKDDVKLVHMLTWSAVTPTRALSFFSRQFPPHPITAQYGIRVLLSNSPEAIMMYIPQLVQAIRYDTMGYMLEFLRSNVSRSQLVCHQLIWNMQTNVFRDEEGHIKDADLYEPLTNLIKEMTGALSGPAKKFYDREFRFFHDVTTISGTIKPFPKGPRRKEACLRELAKIRLEKGCYLPSNPEAIILDIDRKSGTPMQSAAKAPFLARFLVQRKGIAEMEEIALGRGASPESDAGAGGTPNKLRVSNLLHPDVCPERGDTPGSKRKMSVVLEEEQTDVVNGSLEGEENEEGIDEVAEGTKLEMGDEIPGSYWQAAIFKVGDDVRQDMLALQVMQIFQNVLKKVGLELYLFPYRVVATSPGCGVIECVPNATSRDQLGRKTDISMYDYFIKTYGEESSPEYQRAARNFIKSMAAYSVVGFLLQIKDRHNGNIMLDKDGHIIHIDFGFMFESSPGGNLGFEPDIKLTEEMVGIMGGHPESPPFKWFMDLCVKGYLAIRPYCEEIISLVTLMLDTGLPCFRGQTVKLLRARFAPTQNERDAATYMINVVKGSMLSTRTKAYDYIQFWQNEIPY
ncbi:unnamed protein product [Cyprideis torosa]|uniref:1-phosphatidylinositol 4-kinase n=1 Tax=Cyprideis torosa TaxID=163714 RepID=A0A7R8WDD0_9CRUS|nr:unnamed protein product [Cyprideis torosa]CAG0888264.1 unnamed protein product [Cyprideis torosa]